MKIVKNIKNKNKQQIIEFRGLNYQPFIDYGEMRDSLNLTSDYYPNLYQIKGNEFVSEHENIQFLGSKDGKLLMIEGNKLYVDGVEKLSFTPNDNRYAVSINSKIVIFPDNLVYDIVTEESENIALTETLTNVTIKTDRIVKTGLTTSFKKGDGIFLSGFTKVKDNNKPAIISSITATEIIFQYNNFAMQDIEEDSYTEASISIERKSVELDHVCEFNNRLWGCKGKEIFGSKLGDPTNWNYFNGTGVDSYNVTTGTDGNFTGCTACNNHVIFFKESCIHKLFGSKPSNYELMTYQCDGLKKGAHMTIQHIDNNVYYMANEGIMRYLSNLPEKISNNFLDNQPLGITSGQKSNKYYLTTENMTYIYDIDYNTWHKIELDNPTYFALVEGALYYCNSTKLYKIETAEFDSNWLCELQAFSEMIDNKKVLSKLKFTLELPNTSSVDIYVKYDNGSWQKHSTINNVLSGYRTVVFKPRACKKYAIKLEGIGPCKVENMIREYYVGSDK